MKTLRTVCLMLLSLSFVWLYLWWVVSESEAKSLKAVGSAAMIRTPPPMGQNPSGPDLSATAPPTLIADYQFRDNLNSAVGSPPALTNLGNNSFESVTIDDSPRTALRFDQNNGVALIPTTGIIQSQVYTVAVLFAFSNTSGYRRILDFKNGSSDRGLYSLVGRLAFKRGTSEEGSTSTIAANTYAQVVLTRDSAGNVAGYVNGVQQFSFVDNSGSAVIDSTNTLRFFRDNTADTPVGEASAGQVARIRLYNAALSSSEVAALDRLPNPQSGCPSVSFLNPAGGAPGTSITINGSGLTGVTAVRFAGNLAADYNVNDDTQITATVPNGAATGTIAISKPGCGDILTSAVFVASFTSGLVADYQLQNTLSSSVGSPPALTNLGNNSFESVTIDDSPRTALRFNQNNGVELFSTAGIVSNQAYTVAVLFAFSNTSGYRRILDFKNGSSDRGLYSLVGRLAFKRGTSEEGSTSTIAANTYAQVVLTRDSAGNAAGYVNGARQFSFVDNNGSAIIEGNTLRFFRDNTADTPVGEASAGQVARIRLYNAALSSSEVAALDRLPAPSSLSSVSAASFAGANLAPESIVAAFGTGLATGIQTASTLPLPTSLAGTNVKVKDSAGTERLAPLFFVAPGQINYLVPPNTSLGTATITVTSSDGKVSAGAAQIAAVAPGLFAANASGQGVATGVVLRIRGDGSQSFEPLVRFDASLNRFIAIPIDLGPPADQVFLLLYGTGWRFRRALSGVSVKIGGVDAETLFAGPQGDLVGLDQLNIRVPRSLAGRGEVDLTLTVDGKATNTLKVSFR